MGAFQAPEFWDCSLGCAELKSVFTGEISSWSKVGGNDEKIDVLAREAGSGTHKRWCCIGATAASAIGGYPLSRPLFMFMDHDAKPSAQKFIDFCLSEDGQKLVEKAGYASIDRK